MRFLRFLIPMIVITLLFMMMNNFALEDDTFINDPANNENANACFDGGSMAGHCGGYGIATQDEIDWAWRCGWYLIRYEAEIFSYDMMPDDCHILIMNESIETMVSTQAIPTGVPDSDGDGIPDAWEMIYYADLNNDENSDTDADNCNLYCEYLRNLDPTTPDTDNDGIRDGYEVSTDPRNPDTDGDGLDDGNEGLNIGTGLCPDPTNPASLSPPRTCLATNPHLRDTDSDGAWDNVDADPLDPTIQ